MITKLKVMLSSRCEDDVPFTDRTVKLTDFRVELKTHLEGLALGAELELFEVWINEDAPPAQGTEGSWEHCLKQAADCDIFICLYNKEAGWGKGGADIGICHAELQEALRVGRAKVRLVQLPAPSKPSSDAADIARNSRFKTFIDTENLFRGGTVSTFDDARSRVLEALHASIVYLSHRGRVSSKSDKFDRGAALDWNRMNFRERSEEMKSVLTTTLSEREGADKSAASTVMCELSSHKVLLVPQAIPGSLTVPEVKGEVGRPHLQDHVYASSLSGKTKCGPVHVFACHRNVTERQALGILGFPDAVTVVSGFGVYVADAVQMSQLVFLKECRDETSLRHRVQLFFDWLDASGEEKLLVKRGRGRSKIVKSVAKLHDVIA